jgi:hypothetical protein
MTIRNTKETFGIGILSQNEVDQICDTYNVSVKNNCIVFGPPKTDQQRLINQVSFYLANGNQVKSREILKSLNFTSKMIRAYINDELALQKNHPKDSGYLKYKNNPMPKEFIVKGN